jgi:predicted DNA-binding transcriptional regulator AlpA
MNNSPNTQPEYIDSKEAQALLCYKDSSAFRRAVIDLDIPRIVVNSRKTLFPRADILEWLEARKKGHIPVTANY